MNKKRSILILLVINILIVLTGVAFSIYSYFYNVGYLILNTTVAGYVLGLVVVFLGVRYLRSLRKLWKNISGSDAVFSWKNFKRTSTKGQKNNFKKLKII
jgi:NhaP-type Na+/H+ or K+/H+ antiporter